jgi:hypothetical protein
VPAVNLDDLAREPVAENLYLVRSESSATDGDAAAQASVLFCGAMRFNLDALHPLLAMMPELMHAGDLVKRDPAVPALLEAMEREVALDRIGACGILARLADVLAASIIRAWVECGCSDSTGWIAAVQCPKVGKVIAAIHAEPERDWDVPALARLMGASRSRFARDGSHQVQVLRYGFPCQVIQVDGRHIRRTCHDVKGTARQQHGITGLHAFPFAPRRPQPGASARDEVEARIALGRERDRPRLLHNASAVFDPVQPQPSLHFAQRVGLGFRAIFGRFVKHCGKSSMENPDFQGQVLTT